jgi:hypothetical protein
VPAIFSISLGVLRTYIRNIAHLAPEHLSSAAGRLERALESEEENSTILYAGNDKDSRNVRKPLFELVRPERLTQAWRLSGVARYGHAARCKGFQHS